MNREYNSRVSSKNSDQLLKNLQNTTGDYFFLPHPVDISKIFALNREFLGPDNQIVSFEFHYDQPCCQGNEVWMMDMPNAHRPKISQSSK